MSAVLTSAASAVAAVIVTNAGWRTAAATDHEGRTTRSSVESIPTDWPPMSRCGGSRMTQAPIGTAMAQAARPKMIHVARQPFAATSALDTIGTRAMSAPPIAILMPLASPRCSSNQTATVVLAVSVNAPCPSALVPAKPMARVTNPATPAMATSTAPNAAPKSSVAKRRPRRSMSRPAAGMATAPAIVPSR